MCAVAAHHGVHLLVGHHRRYNNLVKAAAAAVAHDIGRLVATNAMVTMRKPDSYYEPEWRRSAGAGPLLVNLIHEVDLQRAVCGDIDRVQAASAKVGRDFDFDDTAAVLLHFRNGALGTILITESTPSPWSWEAVGQRGHGIPQRGPRPRSVRRHRGIPQLPEHDDLDVSTPPMANPAGTRRSM